MNASANMANKRESKVQEWQMFFRDCLKKNIAFELFDGKVKQQASKVSLDGGGIVEGWAGAHDGWYTVRARQARYFEQLRASKTISDVDTLRYISRTLEKTVTGQESYLIKSGCQRGEWKQCIEAVMLEQLVINQMGRNRTEAIAVKNRLQILRGFKPLISLLSAFTTAVGTMTIPVGPSLAIGNALARYTVAYINELAMAGVLTSEGGSAPEGTFLALWVGTS